MIADDEILVRVHAASVDRGTWHMMAGLPYPIRLAGFGFRAPKAPNPGRSVAGTVESMGKDVTGLMPGDEVYGTCHGSFAPYARARAARLAPKPANLTFEHAAAVPVSALTACVYRPDMPVLLLATRRLSRGLDGCGRNSPSPR
jgi:NADPH:quinone reductase-like Zn-dependent oxidoreductase